MTYNGNQGNTIMAEYEYDIPLPKEHKELLLQLVSQTAKM